MEGATLYFSMLLYTLVRTDRMLRGGVGEWFVSHGVP